ncbi:hypothetical protein LFYK43_09490 [Ligilactobacillus salitolerans]|uniref:HTH crp-type domain-containing protein n=1 Tax=Ligilactobacillus salitolerans TaxID=1808352 RepID=A0A401ISG8_9LACO|nr:hypothetical protein LFYK43_09490 [Ligilactobacillus salitolerans]
MSLQAQTAGLQIYWLAQGSLLLEEPCRNGSTYYTYLKAGMYFPADLELTRQETLVSSLHFCEDSVVLAIPFKCFEDLKVRSKHFFNVVHASMLEKYLLQKQIQEQCTAGQITERLQNILIFFGQECGEQLSSGDVKLPSVLTYDTIASFAHTSVQTVGQKVKQFRQGGILSDQSRKLIISRTIFEQGLSYKTAL